MKKYKLLLVLHGYSANGYNEVKSLADCGQEDFIIVAPFGRGNLAYTSKGEQDVLDVKNLVMEALNIDENRVYLIGFSMGGYGTWRLGQFYPDQFAAIAAFCGWTGYGYLSNLQNLPVFAVHGDQDKTVPVEMDRQAAAVLKSLKYSVHYEELPGVGHSAWDGWVEKVKEPARIFEYFRKYVRNPWPKNVNIIALNLRYGRMYWGQVIELENPFKPGNLRLENPELKKNKGRF